MDNIAIEITKSDDNSFVFDISLGETGDDGNDDKRNEEKRNKGLFCDAVAYFYKELASRPTTIHFLIDTVPPIG